MTRIPIEKANNFADILSIKNDIKSKLVWLVSASFLYMLTLVYNSEKNGC